MTGPRGGGAMERDGFRREGRGTHLLTPFSPGSVFHVCKMVLFCLWDWVKWKKWMKNGGNEVRFSATSLVRVLVFVSHPHPLSSTGRVCCGSLARGLNLRFARDTSWSVIVLGLVVARFIVDAT